MTSTLAQKIVHYRPRPSTLAQDRPLSRNRPLSPFWTVHFGPDSPKWPLSNTKMTDFLTKMAVIKITVIWKDHQNDRYSSNKKIMVILVSSKLTFKIKFQNRVGQNNGHFSLDFHGLTVILVFDNGHFRTHSS